MLACALLTSVDANVAVASCGLRLPKELPILDGFRRPPCPRCAGNRGIEYASIPGSVVRSVAAGVVSFSGDVAGVRYVVVDTGAVRVTHGGLRTMTVERGDVVRVGDPVGVAGETLYVGVRRGDLAVDPQSCGMRRTRLVPEGKPKTHR